MKRQKSSSIEKEFIQKWIVEIFFIVLSINLGLWVNNWNNDRQDRLLEKKLLKELRSGLIRDSVELYEIYIYSDSIGVYCQKVIDSLQLNFYNDTNMLDNLIGGTMIMNFVPNNTALESLKSRGFDRITNDSIRSLILDLYGLQYTLLGNIIKSDQSYIDKATDLMLNHISNGESGQRKFRDKSLIKKDGRLHQVFWVLKFRKKQIKEMIGTHILPTLRNLCNKINSQ